ncbi:unnamed protein product [Parnassius apollo]|uniref:(apollo) hypothetical protein n=1 Tax=Parnassius apollo TaxID=110799 RepID=A0A8S3WJB2_PARAO|nr:unnamed protein product [Parnassius apollo]
MALARLLTIIIFNLPWQASNGQQNGVSTSNLASQQALQNSVGFIPQNLNQNVDFGNTNVQHGSPQQSLSMQQLSNIPMQTFNIQQPAGSQPQVNSQLVSFQPVVQSINLQPEVSQGLNLQENVSKHVNVDQILSHPGNFQQGTLVQPTNSQPCLNTNSAAHSVSLQTSVPVQSLNFQQVYPLHLQQSRDVEAGNSQQQTSLQSVNLQDTLPLNFQQQAEPQWINLNQEQVPHHVVVQQQASPQSVHVKPLSIVQPVTYQQTVPVHDSPNAIQLNLQQPSSSLQKSSCSPMSNQQTSLQQNQQQQIPLNNIGGYQDISYQKPYQQTEVSSLPTQAHLVKVSVSPNPTVIAAMPAGSTNSHVVKQTTDHVYVVSPQNYVSSPTYKPVVITDNSPYISTGPTVGTITTVSNSVPVLSTNHLTDNYNQHLELRENSGSNLKIPDVALNILQGQLPITSLLNPPTSSIQSALLSSILSSIKGPSASSQYVVSPNYSAPTILNPQFSSQSSKLSLKSLLPILLNLLQDKYSNCGCRHCCNCECSQNNNIFHEPHTTSQHFNEKLLTDLEETPIKNNEYKEVRDTPVHQKDRKTPHKNVNIIPDDSTELDDENLSSLEEDEEYDSNENYDDDS